MFGEESGKADGNRRETYLYNPQGYLVRISTGCEWGPRLNRLYPSFRFRCVKKSEYVTVFHYNIRKTA